MQAASFRFLMSYRVMRFVSMVFIVCALSMVALAQSESGGGAIQGTVSTPDGQSVPNAAISIRNGETGYVREMVSDDSGHFTALAMPVGVYHLQAKVDGSMSG